MIITNMIPIEVANLSPLAFTAKVNAIIRAIHRKLTITAINKDNVIILKGELFLSIIHLTP